MADVNVEAGIMTVDEQKKKEEREKILEFLQARQQAKDEKEAEAGALKKMKEALKRKEKRLEDAKKNLKKYEDEEKFILQVAGIPTDDEDRPNRSKAIEAFFDVLNHCRFKDSSEYKSFSAMYNQVRPVTLLFDYVREATRYDESTRQIVIDCPALYGMIKERLDAQAKMKKDVADKFASIEKKFSSTGNADKDIVDAGNGTSAEVENGE